VLGFEVMLFYLTQYKKPEDVGNKKVP
jgi:hypothetical protein